MGLEPFKQLLHASSGPHSACRMQPHSILLFMMLDSLFQLPLKGFRNACRVADAVR